MAARKRAEVCEVGVGESVFYETLAKLALQRPQDEGAVNGAGEGRRGMLAYLLIAFGPS